MQCKGGLVLEGLSLRYASSPEKSGLELSSCNLLFASSSVAGV